MFRKSHKQAFSLVIALLSIFVVFFGQSIIYAQEVTPSPTPTPDNRVELIGEIQAMDLDTITVSGQVIDLTMAEINTALEIGAVVKVQGWLLEDGTILAREVNDLNDDDQNDETLTDEVEIVGILSAYEGTTMTIAGQVVDVSKAEIKAGVEVDEYVKAHATIVDGIWVAREVEPAQEDDLSFDNTNDNSDDNGNDNSDDNGNDNDDSDDNGNDNAIVLPPNCVATQPAGWTTYTIKAGDTLSSIANRADSSIGELALANCIADPRFIVAGMTIFVPREPSPAIDNSNNNSNDNGDDDHSNDNGDDDNNNDNHDDNGNDDHDNDNHDDHHNNNDNGDDD